MTPQTPERTCHHCKLSIEIRNPSGFCDHLYYPDMCSVCSGITDKTKENERIALEVAHEIGLGINQLVSHEPIMKALSSKDTLYQEEIATLQARVEELEKENDWMLKTWMPGTSCAENHSELKATIKKLRGALETVNPWCSVSHGHKTCDFKKVKEALAGGGGK